MDSFNNTYRNLDDILALNNPEFSKFTDEIYPAELTLNKSNSSRDHTPFLDLDITINQGKLNTKIYDKRDDFSFPIVNFPHLDDDVPLALLMGSTFHNLFGMHGYAVMFLISTTKRPKSLSD